MGLFERLRRRGGQRRPRAERNQDTEHLRQWASERRGVEGFLEPPTQMTEATIVFVAHDGEWTRRRIGDRDKAMRFTHRLGIPFYEVHKVGYPQRMRDYQRKQRVLRRREYRRRLEEE
ncbi:MULTISPECIES: oxidoreductase [Actinopolyspora]|uniref:Uncharacterized protein n=1 Tax=Actinopolyspora saharensis TaxID=995062 RepID=A0A1H0XUD5_9ACTN|nr:oxidoreductase [Actinopolyspora sp. BKK2]NHE76936.1 oxidoreductase [Actinopolyspora sp. BKK1]SDQ06502.1 hypothetical protein SAMN04489718_0018 [Actinopolyspora saharensis]